jgi:gliding motility-associated-like protein
MVNLGNDTTVCSTINLPINLAGGNYTAFLWQDGSTRSSYDITASGLYSVTVTDANGCKARDTLKVTSIAAGVNLGNDTTICLYDTAVLQVSGNFATIIWQDGSTGAIYNVSQSGVYSVVAVTTSGCTVTDTIAVNVHAPVLSLGNDTIVCPGGIALLQATGNFVSLLWAGGNTGSVFTAGTAGTYYATATDSFGCKVSDSVKVSFYPPVQFNCAPVQYICDSTTSVALNPGNFGTYLWNTGDTAQTITVWQLGTYVVYVTDNNGCHASDSIMVMSCDTQSICGSYFIPNAFTPNGDGHNDAFAAIRKPDTEPAQFFAMSIFDRWGQRMFETNNETTAWDGTFKGKPVPPGVYVYQIKYVTMSNELNIKGAVTLLR